MVILWDNISEILVYLFKEFFLVDSSPRSAMVLFWDYVCIKYCGLIWNQRPRGRCMSMQPVQCAQDINREMLVSMAILRGARVIVN